MEHIKNLKPVFDRFESPAASKEVPVAVIRRLPRYHRYLGELIRRGVLRISSSELSDMMGVTASQIRQDLNCFGGFGQQGYGYHVKFVYEKIGELLGSDRNFGAVFVGMGHLGYSLVNSALLERRGIRKLAAFDKNPSLIGTEVAGVPVYDSRELSRYCRENAVDIAVLAVPRENAAEIAHLLAAAGVRGIWNFSDTELDLHIDGVVIENMHLADSLMGLCYRLRNTQIKTEEQK